MRYLAMWAACAVVALMVVGTSVGAQPEQITIQIDEHFQDEGLTATCGVPIFTDVVGEAKVTLIRNKEGLVVREIDRAGGAKITYRSAQASFSGPLSPSTWDYGDGAVVGSDVVVSFHGLIGHVPGFISSDAGMSQILGVVTGFDEFGIPTFNFVDVIADRGNRHSVEEIDAAICEALT